MAFTEIKSHFNLVNLAFDKKPLHEAAWGKTSLADSNLTCAPGEYAFFENIKFWFSILLLFNSFCFWARNKNKNKKSQENVKIQWGYLKVLIVSQEPDAHFKRI